MKNEGYNLLILESLKFFLENPYQEVYLREFAKKTLINPNTAQRFLNLFISEDLITETKRANSRFFKANLENIVFRFLKKTYSIKKIDSSGLIKYLKEEGFSNVILFGSTSKGLDNPESDIDIVCIGNKQKTEIQKFREKLKKEVIIHFFTFSEWKKQEKQNKAFYQDIISTGINLIGEMPIV